MIIYNVTSNIDESIQKEWLKWMQEKHIPEVLATETFFSARIVKVLVDEEMGGITYSVQFTAENKEKLEEFYNNHQAQFQREAMQLFANKLLTFATELELISDH